MNVLSFRGSSWQVVQVHLASRAPSCLHRVVLPLLRRTLNILLFPVIWMLLMQTAVLKGTTSGTLLSVYTNQRPGEQEVDYDRNPFCSKL